MNKTSVRGHILFFFSMILLLALAWRLTKELEILYVSALFAVVLFPLVRAIMALKVRNRQASRPVAIILLFLAVAAGLTLFFVVALPPVISDLRQFVVDLPGHLPQLVAKIKRIPLADKVGVDSIAQRAEGALSATATYLFASLPNWLSHLFDILTAIFLTIYFMLEGEFAYCFFLSMFRSPNRERLDLTLHKAEAKMSKWLLGQGLLMLILGLASTVTFGLLHVRYFVLLGVLMGLLNIIPIAGGIVTIVLAAGVAALDSWAKMAGVLIFYAVYINIENAYLTPGSCAQASI